MKAAQEKLGVYQIVLGLLTLILSMVLLVWGFGLNSRKTILQKVTLSDFQSALTTTNAGLDATVPPQSTRIENISNDEWLLILEYPPRIRLGDTEIIRLSFVPDDQVNGMISYASRGQPPTAVEAADDDFFEDNRLIAEARLDMVGVETRPPSTVSEPLHPGQPVIFYWSVMPWLTGNYRGTAWLHFRVVDNMTGTESQKAISAQSMEIRTESFLGFSAQWVRTLGVLGIAFGGVLCFPILERIILAHSKRLNPLSSIFNN